MAYFLGNGIWSGIFAVPYDIVDKHIRMCGPLSLKSLMVILRNGGSIDIAQIAQTLGQSEADVKDAVNYWIESGVIHSSPDTVETHATVSAEPDKPKIIPPQPVEEEQKIVSLTYSRPRLTTRQINDMADEDQSIGHLLCEAQQIMGKPLTPVASEAIASLYAYYGMKPDIILMLTQYCVSIGKDSIRYIEKVAATWIEKGIETHEGAEAEIIRLTKQNSMEGKIRSMFGIHDRALVSSEKKYIDTWIHEWMMETPLIEVAFERSVELKGKLSFAYINGILANWYQKNIKTPAQAMGEISRGKQEREIHASSGDASYDMSELESMIAGGK